MAGKKVPHQQGGVWTIRIGERCRCGGITSTPGVSKPVDFIMLQEHLVLVNIGVDGVGIATRYLAVPDAIWIGAD